MAGFANGRVALVAADAAPAEVAFDSLAAKLRGPAAVRRLLSNVLVADDLAAAKQRLPSLADGQAIVTRAGEWLGPGWVRVVRSGEAQHGALAREREIHALRDEIEALARRENELGEQLAVLRDRILEADHLREDAQRSLYLAHRGVSELAGQIQSQQGRLESTKGGWGRTKQTICNTGESGKNAHQKKP